MTETTKKSKKDDDYIRPLWVTNLMFWTTMAIGIPLIIYGSLPIPN